MANFATLSFCSLEQQVKPTLLDKRGKSSALALFFASFY
tara:strand:- start:1269 stop:1385 length:117 start_codon:yes stop_codon:yes gene_type:complete